MKQKALIFDAGTIINFLMNGLLDVFSKLKEKFKGKFIITEEVKDEVIKRPMTIRKFKLGAIRIKKLLDQGILEEQDSYVNDAEIAAKTKEILNFANRTFFSRDKYIHLIDRGEASCLGLSKIFTERGIKNVIVIDERTTRMLSESPENLKKLLETKLHAQIRIKKENLRFFQQFSFIRSTELVYLAFKKGLIDLKNGDVLDALLYAMKYKGCSISREEIEEMKKL